MTGKILRVPLSQIKIEKVIERNENLPNTSL